MERKSQMHACRNEKGRTARNSTATLPSQSPCPEYLFHLYGPEHSPASCMSMTSCDLAHVSASCPYVHISAGTGVLIPFIWSQPVPMPQSPLGGFQIDACEVACADFSSTCRCRSLFVSSSKQHVGLRQAHFVIGTVCAKKVRYCEKKGRRTPGPP